MDEIELKELIVSMMETLVPGEEYSVIVEMINDKYKFELKSESKRAMIAWAEISFQLEDCIDKEHQKTLDF